VPEAVQDFHSGGYQVCEKWLKDRRTGQYSDRFPGAPVRFVVDREVRVEGLGDQIEEVTDITTPALFAPGGVSGGRCVRLVEMGGHYHHRPDRRVLILSIRLFSWPNMFICWLTIVWKDGRVLV
jgi:hypothetical protein